MQIRVENRPICSVFDPYLDDFTFTVVDGLTFIR